jgi:hypothetical protein
MSRPSLSLRGEWYPGERIARRRAAHSYGVVLLLVVTSFVFTASAPDTGWAQSVLVLVQTVTLLAALWTSGVGRVLGRAAVWPSLLLGLLGVIVAGIQLTTANHTLLGVFSLLDGLLVAMTCIVIAVGVADQRAVNAQSVLGAVTIYLELGMLFVFVYGAVAALGSGDFFAQGTDGTPSLRLYFSYVTLATLGYGDYTPASDLGHTMAIVEALVGQLYLVTVVAVVVGGLHRRPVRP